MPEGIVDKPMWAPLKGVRLGETIIVLTKDKWDEPRKLYLRAMREVKHRGAASFWCAVYDAPVDDPWGRFSELFVRFSSDACTDPVDGTPCVGGFAEGSCWRFKLEGEWRNRHITITESLGPAGNCIMYGEKYQGCNTIGEVDATAALAMALGKSQSNDLRYMYHRLQQEPGYQALKPTLAFEHSAGAGNIWTDLISRNKLDELERIAAAYGMRLSWREPTVSFLNYASDVLKNTTHREPAIRITR